MQNGSISMYEEPVDDRPTLQALIFTFFFFTCLWGGYALGR